MWLVVKSKIMTTDLVLNLSPVEFEDVELQVQILPYRDHEQLSRLRADYYTSHVFLRERGTRILCVPYRQSTPEITVTSSFERINLKSSLSLSAALVRNALINYLSSLGRPVLGYVPIRFLANDSNSDLLTAALKDVTKSNFSNDTNLCLDWLSVRVLYELTVREVNFDRQKPFVGLNLDFHSTQRVTKNCEDLLNEGFSLKGLYVGHLTHRDDSRLEQRLELLGRVREVERNGYLQLEDTKPGRNITTINAREALLEPRTREFDQCLKHALREEGQSRIIEVKQALSNQLALLRKGPRRLEKLRTVIEHFAKLNLEMLPGVPFKIQPFLAEKTSKIFPVTYTAPKPTYVFDPTGICVNTWNEKGLDMYGPYTSQSFTPSRPRVCVICQSSYKGRVEQFLHKFFNGLPYQVNDREPFGKGLVRKYALDDIYAEFFVTHGSSAEAYQRAVRSAIEYQTQQSFKWDLALIQVEDRFKSLNNETSPYLVTKAGFLKHQIPVQEFRIENVDQPDKQLVYILNNMALATYAKLGGVPWLMKANPTIAHELVIGLGSAQIGEGRLGSKQRVVGITTVFTGDGNYWLSSLSKAVPIAEYKDALLTSLRTTVKRIQRNMNWQPREHVRLVFHAFKPLKNAEADAVKTLMGELGDYDIDYAFVHLMQQHPYILFDKEQRGVPSPSPNTLKGVMAPTRGLYLRLSDYETLISLTGVREVKRPQDGIPQPIMLQLHRSSSFHDTTYLARQVFAFSCHSWRSFFPSPMPVTILYSNLVARLLGQLARLPHWDADVMLGRIGETRWFL